ncbi:putative enzyme [Frankia canadensis]|uniref:Putative enzyme n=1 Tax=Frankia canadensis TaxID=1836972 RepID=A0A2I2KHV5_9ACTN|nr:CoA transferase [Frankia canadensis]SNQ45245.1 putative enzyme [Frankia canadensis]SOU52535.1 putative enzyme [Frankia canadensis]
MFEAGPLLPAGLPLAGVRVLDWTDGRCEATGRYLGELGAQVVRVEPPGGVPARRLDPLTGAGLDFAIRSINKRSVVLDPHSAIGRSRLRGLLAEADIVLDSSSPGEHATQEFAPDALLAANPTLVVVLISDFGSTGPYRDWTATPDVLMAVGGLLSRSGLPGLPPLLPPEFLADECAAAQAAWAALMAHANRLDTGRGDIVDFSRLEAVAQTIDPGYGIAGSARAGTSIEDLPRERPDARHLYPIFRCADGLVRICVLSPRQWRGMLRWLGGPERFADPRYADLGARFAAAGELYPLISALFADRTRDQIIAESVEFGVPAAALLQTAEVVASGHAQARGAFRSIELSPGVTVPVPDGLVEINGQRAGYRSGPPALGECDPDELVEIWRREADSASDAPYDPAPRRGTAIPAVAAHEPAPRHPFRGLRVLDLGVIVVGAEIGRLFADHGAEVIKIENRAFPDGGRQGDASGQVSESFARGHRNKKSLGLNLRHPHGRDLFLRLVVDADVVVSNFKPGTMESLGLGYDDLFAVNPKIIFVESSAFGATGPWSRRLGYGPLVRATAGLSNLWCYPDAGNGICDAITVYPDHVVARVGATAALAMLINRRRTGRGGTASVAQIETICWHMAGSFAKEHLRPGSVRPEGNDRRGDAPRGLFACAGDDEWCVIDVRGDETFQRLATTIGHPEWLGDSRFITAQLRDAHRDMLRAAVEKWTAARSPAEVAHVLQAHGVPAGQMHRIHDLASDPQFVERRFLVRQEQPQFAAPLLTQNGEARFREVADPVVGPAPLVAEHTRELAAKLLGLSDIEIDDLIEDGVLEVTPTW